MERQEDEKLWDLLGQARQPDISPFFARDILRRLRSEPSWVGSVRAWFSVKRLVPATAIALAIIGLATFGHWPSMPQRAGSEDIDPVAKVDPQDYEVVADLDDLIASDENSLWDENSSL